MLSSKQIQYHNNCLRMTFVSDTRDAGSTLSQPVFQVPMMDYINRFDPARPVFCALESVASENNLAIYEVIHVCFDSLMGVAWSSTPDLANSIGVAFKQNMFKNITSDTVGTPINNGVLRGGTWQFSIRDVFGDLTANSELDLSYTFTIILYQKSELK